VSVVTRAALALAKLPRRTAVRDVEGLTIPMPDGVVLLGDRYAPVGPSGDTAPILLTRHPYGLQGVFGVLARALAAASGYQVVAVSCRGTFGSGGEWVPFRNEEADGKAVLAWLQDQPWFSGAVGTWGGSYFGLTQWAVAKDAPPWLRSMSLGITSSWFRDIIYPRDVFALESMMSWVNSVEHQEEPTLRKLRHMARAGKDLARLTGDVQLHDADKVVVGRTVGFYQDWVAHAAPEDPWWDEVHFGKDLTGMPPVSLLAGWYDLFLQPQLEDFKRLQAAGAEATLLVGPWTHGSPPSLAALLHETVDWADEHLKGLPRKRTSPVRVFVLGAKRWLDLEEWPPASTPATFHLQPQGGLAEQPPPDSSPDAYHYDPSDPTPSVGGNSLARTAGPKDNAAVEARADVLTYTSAPLASDLTVIGEVSARLFVRSSLEHTDFFVRLCAVSSKGRSTNVCDGLVRVQPGVADPQPDGTREVHVPLAPTAVTFRRGERIRVQVSSGAHPLYARNPGDGSLPGETASLIPADVEVCHDTVHPSALVLPVFAGA
jgi:putative CocE/NonD family hydrolase